MIKKLELSPGDHDALIQHPRGSEEYCFLSTVLDTGSADTPGRFQACLFSKSFRRDHQLAISEPSLQRKPVILSTGMSDFR